MEDMATGEIRLSILWEWLHKRACFTEDDVIAGNDEKHSETENRFYALGQTDSGRQNISVTVSDNNLPIRERSIRARFICEVYIDNARR
jgi:malate synthase